MFRFIRQHWVAYLVGAVIAILLGFGAAFVVDIKGSTPEKERDEQVAKEMHRGASEDALAAQADKGSAAS